MKKQSASTSIPSFLARLTGRKAYSLKQEKARLEAFLSAFPGDYCGWGSDRTVVYSQGFCDLLGLESINTLADIQNRLTAGDAAALEGMMDRLREHGARFEITVHSHDELRTFKLYGTKGRDSAHHETTWVLWIEDITETLKARNNEELARQEKMDELGRYKIMLDNVPRPLWIRDQNQNLIWCNGVYGDYLGLSRKDVIDEQKDLFSKPLQKKGAPADDSSPERDLAKKAFESGEPQSRSGHVVVRGNRLLMQATEIPIPEHDMTLGIAYNITREEELEGKLKRFQSSNNELLEQLRSAIAIYASDQSLEFYNSAFAQLWDLEAGWLNRKPKLGDIMEKLRETRRLPEQADFRRFKQSWLDMFTGLIDPYEDMLYLPDGSALRMLVVPHSIGGLMMTFEDVTSRLELESSYNTLIAVQKETLDNLGEAVVVYGGDGRLKLCNPAFSRLWGLHPEDLEGEPHITKIVEKKKSFFTKEEWSERKDDLIAKGLDRIMHESRLARADGTLVDYSTVPLPDGGVLITYSDVTDTVRVENALREKNAALEAAEQLKLDFLANVSYQLRTPLNAIMGFTEILDQEYFGKLNKRQKEYTHDITQASERLLSLINDILDLSTLEAGYMTLSRSDIRVMDALQNVIDLVSEWARKENIELILECPKNIGSLSADHLRLQQALINVIRNAITHTPSGGTITLRARRRKSGIEIAVEDTGVGIAKEDRSRIFEPFERAQRGSGEARVNRSGAGLGLSLVKNIVSLHGGTVALDSAPDKGTTVTLFLPFTAIKTGLNLPIEKAKKQAEKA